ncbi:hypothetical protein WK03_35695 [Burkholderia cepacia]|uniref:hypothetical protein n=1 Tax=Burkholderia cepacia TaxID=292 RepID=UPI00075B22BB|nr:hypothetical protein [Burkholderia cepacia]KVQ35811.1 hypothetical protein WK03_35695 [Burkholderia cepacia]
MSDITRALIVASPHIEKILAGEKTWEMRTRHVHSRGPIALIAKGTGAVVGVAEITDSLGPLSEADLFANASRHRIDGDRLISQLSEGPFPEVPKRWSHAWVLEKVLKLIKPVHYRHPNGAQQFVILDEPAIEAIAKQVAALRKSAL